MVGNADSAVVVMVEGLEVAVEMVGVMVGVAMVVAEMVEGRVVAVRVAAEKEAAEKAVVARAGEVKVALSCGWRRRHWCASVDRGGPMPFSPSFRSES